MRFARKTFIPFLLAAVLLISCGPQSPSVPTVDVDSVMTAGVATFAAAVFQTQTAMYTPPTPTPLPTDTPLATPTVPTPIILESPTLVPTLIPTQPVFVAPAFTVTPTGTFYTATANPSTLGYGCNNLALLADETVPAGTVFTPQEVFTKTWKVANTGTCDWVYQYHMTFISGTDLAHGGPNLGKIIPPGKWTQLSLEMQAPKQEGKYTGYYRFSDQSGNPFGSTLAVSIEVKAP